MRRPYRLFLLTAATVCTSALLLTPATDTAAVATTFTVNSAADPGDGICDAAECTLREAIDAANTNDGKDTIAFSIPGAGPHTIAPFPDLPEMFEPVALDATSQPGYAGTPLIMLDGGLGASVGLFVVGGSSEVRGFAIGNFENSGILIHRNGDNVVQANHIGTDSSGLSREGNFVGVHVFASAGNLIGGNDPADGNLVSGNLSDGIRLDYADGNQIAGNLIGTDITGWNDLRNENGVSMVESSDNVVGKGNVISGNSFAGVWLLVNAHRNVIEGNRIGTNSGGQFEVPNIFGVLIEGGSSHNKIGGAAEAQRNVISGNLADGVHLFSQADHNRILGNLIGTDIWGITPVPNGTGVSLLIASDNQIGGTAPGEGNVISGNHIGVEINGESSSGNRVEGNYIGTDPWGWSVIPNELHGVLIWNAPNNTIGGGEPGARNQIAGSHENIMIQGFGSAVGSIIQGNYIGITADGSEAIGESGVGVLLSDASETIIGGTDLSQRNVIAGHELEIAIERSTDNTVLGNYLGMDAQGLEVLGRGTGVHVLFGSDNVIGGGIAGAGNLIGDRVAVELTGSSRNVIQGNFLGTDVTGNGRPRQGGDRTFGVTMTESSDNLIGGADPGTGNVIGNYVFGVELGHGSSGNRVEGNSIGVGADGVTVLSVHFPVRVLGSRNTIGGLADGAGNTIANGLMGVNVVGGQMNAILSNEIAGTDGGLGIDLGDDGVTPNDPGDADLGPNGLQNFPNLTVARTDGQSTTIAGSLDSLPDETYTVQLFSSISCNSLGFGNGEDLLGTIQVAVPTVGPGEFDVELPVAVAEGQFITATATDPSGNTSEFSACVEVELDPCTDLNDDGRTTGRDLAIVASALPSAPGDRRWNPHADVNLDNVVNLSDLFVVISSMHDPECDR